jgi:hypothetical protein
VEPQGWNTGISEAGKKGDFSALLSPRNRYIGPSR